MASMDTSKPRKKRTTLKKVEKYFEECTGSASVHGVQYVGDRRRSCFERLLWAAIVATSVSLCTYFVLKTYMKWNNSPVYVTVGTELMPIHNIAFPAITVCPETKSDSDLFRYSDSLNKAFPYNTSNLTETERLQFEYMSMICNRTQADEDDFKHETFDADFYHFIRNVTPNFNLTFTNCRFSSGPGRCEQFFTPIFTRDGLCYTFNALNASEVFQENVEQLQGFYEAPKSVCFNQKYSSACENPYPRRASFSGVDAGLVVELSTQVKDMEFKCASALQGFKVIVHDAKDAPTENHNYFRVPLNQAVFAALSPEVIMTKKSLEAYTASQRKCYFNKEKSLVRFKHYSRSNCEIECLSYLMENILECLDFYLPRINRSSPVCGAAQLEIIDALEHILVTYITNTTTLNLPPDYVFIKVLLEAAQMAVQTQKHCDCLPSCTSIEYKLETTQTIYYWHKFEGLEDLKDTEHRSLLNVYFKDAYYIPMQREEMFGSMDFIAYCGGLLGLFIGFSFISLVEIVYYSTLRIACNVRMFGRKMWHGDES